MPILKNDAFYCDHLGTSKNDIADIQNFSVKDVRGEGLANYLKNIAVDDENNGVMRTYLARDNHSSELVGYFSLKAGLISFNEDSTGVVSDFDTLPGVELANFAVNNAYVSKHPKLKGIGFTIFTDFIKPFVKDIAKLLGVKFIYIFALPFERLIKQYGRYGFQRLDPKHEVELHRRLKPRYDSECIFMYQML